MYRVQLGKEQAALGGPEYQIVDHEGYRPGADKNNPRQHSGAIFNLYANDDDNASDVGDWNTSRIIHRGNKVEHWLNGKLVVTADIGSDNWNSRIAGTRYAKHPEFSKNPRGHLVLQGHKKNNVWFKDIVIQDLSQQSPASTDKQPVGSAVQKRVLDVGQGVVEDKPDMDSIPDVKSDGYSQPRPNELSSNPVLKNFGKGSVWKGTRHTEKSGTVKKAVMYIADRNEDKFTGTLAVTNPRGVNQLQIEGAIQGKHITISCESDKGQPSTVSGQINGEELILIGDNPDSGTQTYSLKPVDSIEDGDKSTDKFVQLWNGKDIEGWEFPFGQVKLESKDGILNATWTNRVYQALVTKKDDYENFHLRVRMRIDSKSLGSELNTHWFIRGNQARDGMFGWAFSLGGKKSRTRDGLLFADMGKFRLLTGGRIGSSAHSIAVPKNKGTVDGVTAAGPITKAVSLDEWHDLDFLAYGNTVSMIVDGKLVTTATDNKDRIRKGEIGLRPQRNAHLQFEVFEVLELGSNSEAEMYAKQLLEAL